MIYCEIIVEITFLYKLSHNELEKITQKWF